MSASRQKPPVSIWRTRPINASGLFWSLVSILAGFFYGGICSSEFYFVFGISALLGVIWQFKKWSWDLRINRSATEWCRTHYPTFVGTPIMDFIVAFAQIVHDDFGQLAPLSLLDDLNRTSGNAHVGLFVDVKQMLGCVVMEARIRDVVSSEFSGSTLDDAIQFVCKTSESSDRASTG